MTPPSVWAGGPATATGARVAAGCHRPATAGDWPGKHQPARRKISKRRLPEHVNPAGVLASGLRRPNGKIICQGADAACPPARMEKIFRQLAAARALFAAENPFPRWLAFAFEHGQIRLVVRPEGWLFAIALRPETDAAQNLDALSAEFLALNLK